MPGGLSDASPRPCRCRQLYPNTSRDSCGGYRTWILLCLTRCATIEVLMRGSDRYTFSARCYDVISGEWPVYRAGRIVGIDLLALIAGDEVLDIACGTGLNFAHLQRRIGPSGTITAIDVSEQMLDQARRRVRKSGWRNVRLIQADAADVKPASLGRSQRFDAAISTYGLSLMPQWRRALARMVEVTRAGGRVAIVDMQNPVGFAAVLSPLAQLACQLGGSDINAHPWTPIESSLTDVRAASVRGGHIQVRAGAIPGHNHRRGETRSGR